MTCLAGGSASRAWAVAATKQKPSGSPQLKSFASASEIWLSNVTLPILSLLLYSKTLDHDNKKGDCEHYRMLRTAVGLISNYQNTAYRRHFASSNQLRSGRFGQCLLPKPPRCPPISPVFSSGIALHIGLAPSSGRYNTRSIPQVMASDYSTRLKAVHQIRPHSPSPATGTARSDLAKTQLRAYSSRMVSQSVNKTALHPGGVE